MTTVSILIVDDRKENLLALENILESPEVEIVSAESGEEALGKTLDHEFALILMDVQMPVMDGYETAELMRGNRKTRNIPIIFVTAARKDDGCVFKGYDSGAVDYLFKPLEPIVLKSKVGVFLELHRQNIALKEKTQQLDAKIAELEELKKQLEESNEKLQLLSSLDGLTGLLNRRSFDELLDKEWQRGIRHQKPLTLILIDIDHFKSFNDSYGHIAGDQCLKEVAHALEQSIHRDIDIIARYGGEEFAVILPTTDMEGAQMVAERIRQNIYTMGIEHKASRTCAHVTVSLGVCSLIPQKEDTPTSLIASADTALYLAKAQGRNCCRFSED